MNIRNGKMKHGHNIGHKPTKEYSAWISIKGRCMCPSHKNYVDYGGRGIKICDKWLNSFENFLADVGESPSKLHWLDRYPNNDGDYEPNNVRWATPAQQTRNRRSNIWIEHNGVKLVLSDWAKELKIDKTNLKKKLSKQPFSFIYDKYKTI